MCLLFLTNILVIERFNIACTVLHCSLFVLYMYPQGPVGLLELNKFYSILYHSNNYVTLISE